ncbi:hypothetical protein HCN44_008727, partial [Aphidius gifuensis]
MENKKFVLVEFPEEKNKVLVGHCNWLEENKYDDEHLKIKISEKRKIKLEWPENYDKVDMKKYVLYPEKHEWIINVKAKILSIGTFIEMNKDIPIINHPNAVQTVHQDVHKPVNNTM